MDIVASSFLLLSPSANATPPFFTFLLSAEKLEYKIFTLLLFLVNFTINFF